MIKKPSSLKNRFLLIGSIGAICISFAFFIQSYVTTIYSLEEINKNQISNTSKTVRSLVENDLVRPTNQLIDFVRSSNTLSSYFSSTEIERIIYKTDLEREIIRVKSHFPKHLKKVVVLDLNGEPIAGIIDKKRIRNHNQFNQTHLALAERTKTLYENRSQNSLLIKNVSSQTLSVVSKFSDPESGTVAGSIYISWNINKLISSIDSSSSEGVKLCSMTLWNRHKKEYSCDPTQSVSISLDDGTVIFKATFGPDHSYLNKKAVQQSSTQFLIILLILCVVAPLTWIPIQRILESINALKSSTHSVTEGNYETPLKKPGYFELDTLIEDFESMKSRQKTLIEELSEQKSLLETVFSEMGEGVGVISSDGNFVISNNVIKILLPNLTNPEQRNYSFYEDGSNTPLTTELLPFQRALDGEYLDNIELTIKYDGKYSARNILVSAKPLYDSKNRIQKALIVVRDITDIVDAQNMLQSTQKLAAIGEMAGGIAHEINNPLAIIHSSAEMIQDCLAEAEHPDQDAVMCADTIVETVDRVTKITNGLRKMARNSSNEPYEITSVKRVIDETLSLCNEKIKSKEVKLDVKIENGDIPLECYGTQISQVVLNLLNNAIDAILPLEDRWIEIEASRLGADKCVIHVTDSGLGIPDELADRILNPFFTTKSKGMGTGLGLSIANTIINRHNGTLYIDKTCPNTRFKITLPLKKPTSNAAA